jgi:hypothetical protein
MTRDPDGTSGAEPLLLQYPLVGELARLARGFSLTQPRTVPNAKVIALRSPTCPASAGLFFPGLPMKQPASNRAGLSGARLGKARLLRHRNGGLVRALETDGDRGREGEREDDSRFHKCTSLARGRSPAMLRDIPLGSNRQIDCPSLQETSAYEAAASHVLCNRPSDGHHRLPCVGAASRRATADAGQTCALDRCRGSPERASKPAPCYGAAVSCHDLGPALTGGAFLWGTRRVEPLLAMACAPARATS